MHHNRSSERHRARAFLAADRSEKTFGRRRRTACQARVVFMNPSSLGEGDAGCGCCTGRAAVGIAGALERTVERGWVRCGKRCALAGACGLKKKTLRRLGWNCHGGRRARAATRCCGATGQQWHRNDKQQSFHEKPDRCGASVGCYSPLANNVDARLCTDIDRV